MYFFSEPKRIGKLTALEITVFTSHFSLILLGWYNIGIKLIQFHQENGIDYHFNERIRNMQEAV